MLSALDVIGPLRVKMSECFGLIWYTYTVYAVLSYM